MSQDTRVPEAWRLGEDFVPKGRYIDRDFLQLEYQRLFPRLWQMACREEEIPAVGSHLEYQIGDQSVVVVRSESGIKAFYNACIHRGTRLVRGRGRASELRCPFHGWRFALDGECTFMYCADEFNPRPEAQRRLREIRCDSWGGWVFVCFDPDAEPLLDWLDPIPQAVAPWRLDEMRYLWHKRTILPANWKTAIDAFIEGYHTPGTHPQYGRFDQGAAPSTRPTTAEEFGAGLWTPTITYRNHSRFVFGMRDDGASHQRGPISKETVANNILYQVAQLRALNTESDARAARELLDTDLAPGANPYAELSRLRRKHAEADGVRLPEFTHEQLDAGAGDWHVLPTLVILLELGCALGYRSLPNGDDPDSCVFDVWSLQLFGPGKQPHVELEFHERWQDGDFGQVLEQDFRNMSEVTAGLHQRGFEGHWLNTKQEMSVHNAHRIADRFLFDA
ncbi:MAG: aromatic ring-hydroxylating dioxygenase subunit alpha [Myxococcota bacterium]|nr:aromatic ring-hydroxylating dioxygenase subunit alpha [Myxococcota bacterium]